MIRGTTPSLRWNFSKIPVSTITAATMTVVQGGNVIATKHLSDATVGDSSLTFTLTQQETLALKVGLKAEIQLKYKTEDGLVGASTIYEESGDKILDDEVI